jgi:hypothetical protein
VVETQSFSKITVSYLKAVKWLLVTVNELLINPHMPLSLVGNRNSLLNSQTVFCVEISVKFRPEHARA